MVEELVRVQFCCLSSRKTTTSNIGRTVLGHHPSSISMRNRGKNSHKQNVVPSRVEKLTRSSFKESLER